MIDFLAFILELIADLLIMFKPSKDKKTKS